MTKNDSGPQGPLTPIVFHILLALSDGPLHGYAIMKAVEKQSEGAVKTGPGTTYGSIERMETAGLVEEAKSSEHRKRAFQITREGRLALVGEASRIASVANLIKSKKIAQ